MGIFRGVARVMQAFAHLVAHVPEPPWPNGQGVGLLIRRLRIRVPQGVRINLHQHALGCPRTADFRAVNEAAP